MPGVLQSPQERRRVDATNRLASRRQEQIDHPEEQRSKRLRVNVTRCLPLASTHRRLQEFKGLAQELEVEVVNAAGSVESTYSLAGLEALDDYTISTKSALGASVVGCRKQRWCTNSERSKPAPCVPACWLRASLCALVPACTLELVACCNGAQYGKHQNARWTAGC